MAVAADVWCVALPPGIPEIRHRGLWHTGDARIYGSWLASSLRHPGRVAAGGLVPGGDAAIVASMSRR